MAQQKPEEIELVTLGSASEFLQEADGYFRANEDISSPIFGVARLVKDGDPVFTGPFAFAVARDGEQSAIGCLAHAKPDGLMIDGLGLPCSAKIFAWAQDQIGQPSRIAGDQELTMDLAARWIEAGNARVELEDSWRIFRLDAVVKGRPRINGSLRMGRADDAELVARWGDIYGKEKPAFLNVSAFFARKLERCELFVWDDGGARTMVTISARTPSGIRISGVFTPPEYRGRGYAEAAVSEVSRHMMDGGLKFITLVTQANDPVESLYERIGFACIGASASVTFEQG